MILVKIVNLYHLYQNINAKNLVQKSHEKGIFSAYNLVDKLVPTSYDMN